MKNNKPFLSVSEQIYKLRSQGLKIFSDDSTKDILRTHSYYSFVNGYCDLLVKSKSPRQFKVGASFEELTAIYDFDTSFREYLFPQILYIEEKIKATCINVFCGYKEDNTYLYEMDKYLDVSIYDTVNETKKDAAKKLIKSLKRAIKSNIDAENKPFVYSQSTYGYVPFWILTTNMSFGQISRFYECINVNIRTRIAKRYHLSEKDLRTVLKILSNIRNLCAHNNRVYLSRIPYMLSPSIGLGVHNTRIDPRCNHKFGSALYALRFLLNQKKFGRIIQELSKSLTILNKKLRTITIKDVLLKMGISPLMVKEMGIIIN